MTKKLLQLALLLFLIGATFPLAHAFGNSETSMLAYKTKENITVDGYSDEGFWSTVPWTSLTLSPSDSYGGAVKELSIKAANNGSWVFLLARWTDYTESRKTDPVVRNSTGGYIHNATYYYGDILWVDWSLLDGGHTKPSVSPYGHTRFAGTPGSGKQGLVANLWSWRSYEDAGGPMYPYHYFPPSVYTWGPNSGKPLVFPYSAAYDSYLNATAQYFVGTGVMRVEACAAPLDDLDPFVVRAQGNWANHQWTVEFARPYLSPPNTSNSLFDIQLAEGGSYWVGFAVADGNSGEVYNTNSVSNWVQITLTSQYNSLEAQLIDNANALQTLQIVTIVAIGVSALGLGSSGYLLTRRRRT